MLEYLSPSLLAQGSVPNLPLPGSGEEIEKAVAKSQYIVVAKLLDIGPTVPDGAGKIEFTQAKIEIVQTIKGNAIGTLTVSITLFSGKEVKERVPEEGKPYLFFILSKKGTSGLDVIKILPSDDSTVNSIKAAVARGR